ncbi:MAG: NUDIX domain-containing protein [Candidatus Moranbacteria bacterium]|nr:NUDIX domain-containing protein [Candidatus Moranbacteria bacterium]
MQKIIIASGPLIVEDEKVLLNKHGDTAFWKFCGGRVEDFSQDLIENARRKAKEEMGIEIEIQNLEPFITHAQKETPEGKIDVILVHYLAERIGKINPGKDIREWNWLETKNLPEDLGPNIRPALEHFGFL